MKEKILLLIIMGIITSYGNAQEFYLKFSPRYHVPITYQQAPEYFSAYGFSGPGYTVNPFNPEEKPNFSLAQGMSAGITPGYHINEYLGVEFGIDFFYNQEKYNPDQRTALSNRMTKWKYWTLNTSPVIKFGQKSGNSAFYVRAGAIVGLSTAIKGVGSENFVQAYRLKTNICYGYTFGIEYDYALNSSISLFTEAGIEDYYYTPKKAELWAKDLKGYNSKGQTVSTQKVEYQKDLNNVPMTWGFYQNAYYNPNEPTKRLTETLKLNSLYFGVGLIFKIKKHEKD